MNLSDFDALSFDCYGTLIDWEHGLREGLQRIARHSVAPITVDELLESYAEAEARTEREHPPLLYPDVVARSAAATGEKHGIVVPSQLALEIGNSVPGWPAFPDSTDALQRLSQRYKLIILSNVDRASFAGSNQRLGVTFDAIITAEDVGSYKPARDNFEALLAKVEDMGITKDRLLHVAQSLFHDHVPAKEIGCKTVWIDRRGDTPGSGATPVPTQIPEPDWIFPSMAAFAEAVEADFELRSRER